MSPEGMPTVRLSHGTARECTIIVPNLNQVRRAIEIIGRHQGATAAQIRDLISAISRIRAHRLFERTSDKLQTTAEIWCWNDYRMTREARRRGLDSKVAWADKLSFHCHRLPDGRIAIFRVTWDRQPFPRDVLCMALGLDPEPPVASGQIEVSFEAPEEEHHDLIVPIRPLEAVLRKLFVDVAVKTTAEEPGYIDCTGDLARHLVAAYKARQPLELVDDLAENNAPKHPILRSVWLSLEGYGEYGVLHLVYVDSDDVAVKFHELEEEETKRRFWFELTLYPPHPAEAAHNAPFMEFTQQVKEWLEYAYGAYFTGQPI